MLKKLDLFVNLFGDLKIKNYLKKATKQHPEVENYGLNCDTQLWAYLNKEIIIRDIAYKYRETLNNMYLFTGQIEKVNNDDLLTDNERLFALSKLSLLIKDKKVNKLTYLKEYTNV